MSTYSLDVIGQNINGNWYTGAYGYTFYNGSFAVYGSTGVFERGNYYFQGNVITISSYYRGTRSYTVSSYGNQMVFQNNFKRVVYYFVSHVQIPQYSSQNSSYLSGEDKRAYQQCMNGDQEACMRWMKSLDNIINKVLDNTDSPQLVELRRKCQTGDLNACQEETKLRQVLIH